MKKKNAQKPRRRRRGPEPRHPAPPPFAALAKQFLGTLTETPAPVGQDGPPVGYPETIDTGQGLMRVVGHRATPGGERVPRYSTPPGMAPDVAELFVEMWTTLTTMMARGWVPISDGTVWVWPASSTDDETLWTALVIEDEKLQFQLAKLPEDKVLASDLDRPRRVVEALPAVEEYRRPGA